MANQNKNFKLSNLSQDKLSLATPYSTTVNTRGNVLYDNYTAFFTSGEFTIYGEKDGKAIYLRQPMKDQYPSIQTLRMNVSEENIPALKSLDDFFRESLGRFEELSGLSDLSYRSFLRPYTRQDGTTVYSCDLNLDVRESKDSGDLSYLTKFFDDTNQPVKVESFDALTQLVGSRCTVNVKFVIDYQVRGKNNEVNAVLKAKFVQFRKDRRQEIDPELKAVRLHDIDINDLKADIKLIKGEDGMMTKQKMARVQYKEAVGKRFRLEDFVLTKGEGSYVGLPPESFDGDDIRPKISIIATDGNQEVLEKLDQVFSERNQELREMWDITKKSKLDYVSCMKPDSTDALIFKLELFDREDNKTKFIIDGKELEWSSKADLREYVKLGTQFKNVNVVISKVWHSKTDKQYSIKLKLKSCVLVPDQRTKQSRDYLEFGKFTDELV